MGPLNMHEPESVDWPAHWWLQSEHVRGERRFYWIEGMTRAEKNALDVGRPEGDRRLTVIRRANRFAQALKAGST